MSTALGVDNIVNSDASVTGTDALQLRNIIKSRFNNIGIVSGLTVTGRSDLKYNVSAGVAVCSRGTSDGYTEAYYAGGTTDAVSAGDASNPRIDLVYILPHDKTQGDSDNQVVVGVVQGTPAASPKKPSAPSGATVLSVMRMESGATTTAAASRIESINYAIPYGASFGLLKESVQTMDGVGDRIINKYYIEQPTSFNIPTDRFITFRFYVCASASSDYSDWYQSFVLDGNEIPHSGGEFHFTEGWATQMHAYSTLVQSGTHTAAVRTGLRGGSAPIFHYGGDQYTSFIGRRLQVWDSGVSK